MTPGGSKSKSQLITVFLTVFIDLLGFGIVIPLLPIYSLRYDAGEFELALLFCCFSLMQFIFAPFWGRVSDKFGRRPVLIGGLVGTGLSYLLFAFADSMALLYTSRLLAGFFGANVSTAQAYIADVTTAENRAKGMGMIGAAFGLGFTAGPWVGGEFAGIWEPLPGLFATGLSFAAATFGYFNLKEPERHRGESSRVFGLDTLREAGKNPRIGTIIFLYFLGIMAFSGFESMFIRFGMAKFPGIFNLPEAITDASVEQILAAAPIAGRYMGAVGLIAAFIQGGLIRRLVPKFGETKLIIAGPFILGISLAIMGAATGWWMVIFGAVLMPCGFGINNPSLNGLLSRAAPADHQGAFLGLNQSGASLARVAGPLLAGSVFEHIGPSWPFYVSAGILLIATIIALNYRRQFRQSYNQ